MEFERFSARIERIAYDVGYRLTERVSQSKPFISISSDDLNNDDKLLKEDNVLLPSSSIMQLEAVKFICKEFWIAIFGKQIDKLQTNHRGVFVLRDDEFKWLRLMSSNNNISCVGAVKLLNFPCGLIRGALKNLGIDSHVISDYITDGNMISSCSFNIKINTDENTNY